MILLDILSDLIIRLVTEFKSFGHNRTAKLPGTRSTSCRNDHRRCAAEIRGPAAGAIRRRPHRNPK